MAPRYTTTATLARAGSDLHALLASLAASPDWCRFSRECGVSPSCAQEEKFARSTYPIANARPDGSRDLNPIANISGLWQSQSGARYSCSQNGRGFTCIAVAVTEPQARAGVRVGDVAFTGIVYEYVAIADFIGRVPSNAGAAPTCPSSYFKQSTVKNRDFTPG